MEEKFKAYQICNFFASQLKNENVLILDNNIHFNGVILLYHY
jgi:hypothetical protein